IDTPPPYIYTLSLHDALPISAPAQDGGIVVSAEAAAAVGHPEKAVPLSEAELSERVRSPVFRRGVFFPDGATVHPGLLVRALRRSEEHTSELQSRGHLVCRLL